jgi:uncharacterized membrane protein
MHYLLSNPKTSLAGAGALFAALGHLLNALASGDTSTLLSDGSLIIAAIGVLFAKDGNVTGGSKKQ